MSHGSIADWTEDTVLEALESAPVGGLTLDQICDATGWNRHTVHGTLCELKDLGHEIKNRKDRHKNRIVSFYFLKGRGGENE